MNQPVNKTLFFSGDVLFFLHAVLDPLRYDSFMLRISISNPNFLLVYVRFWPTWSSVDRYLRLPKSHFSLCTQSFCRCLLTISRLPDDTKNVVFACVHNVFGCFLQKFFTITRLPGDTKNEVFACVRKVFADVCSPQVAYLTISKIRILLVYTMIFDVLCRSSSP